MTTKSGLRKLAPSEILFHDGDTATSLFIIQKGQLRLFKPKGKGFVEIAVLRAGEVIGEMAYFDESGGRKRSCSAEAMTNCEVIEIGFTAFAKTMENLNPWFKTIINTLATRLRATNMKVKELESNSTSVNYATGKHSGYEFLKTNDVLKILATTFLIFKSHAEDLGEGKLKIPRNTLKLYFQDVYSINDSKYEALLFILEKLEIMQEITDESLTLSDIIKLREIFIFYQTQKHLPENKKIFIPYKEQVVLEEVLKRANKVSAKDSEEVLISVENLENVDDLIEAKEQDFIGPIIVEADNSQTMAVNQRKLKKYMPLIQFMNEIEKINREKGA